jgi:hypothetical protein
VTPVLVRTDDEVYRVDSVWLGPPRATFPWRARYVSYGLGLLVMILVMFVQRRIGIGLDFFSVAWALIVTIVCTRFLGQRIDYERPLGQVVALFWHEVSGPRERAAAVGGQVRAGHVRIGPVGRSRPQTGRPLVGGPRSGRAPGRATPAAAPASWARSERPARPRRAAGGAGPRGEPRREPQRERARAAP